MANDATRREFVRPREDHHYRKTDGDQYDEYGHRVFGDGQAVEGDVRYLQKHPGDNAVGHERTKHAAVAEFLYQLAYAILHRRGVPYPARYRVWSSCPRKRYFSVVFERFLHRLVPQLPPITQEESGL